MSAVWLPSVRPNTRPAALPLRSVPQSPPRQEPAIELVPEPPPPPERASCTHLTPAPASPVAPTPPRTSLTDPTTPCASPGAVMGADGGEGLYAGEGTGVVVLGEGLSGKTRSAGVGRGGRTTRGGGRRSKRRRTTVREENDDEGNGEQVNRSGWKGLLGCGPEGKERRKRQGVMRGAAWDEVVAEESVHYCGLAGKDWSKRQDVVRSAAWDEVVAEEEVHYFTEVVSDVDEGTVSDMGDRKDKESSFRGKCEKKGGNGEDRGDGRDGFMPRMRRKDGEVLSWIDCCVGVWMGWKEENPSREWGTVDELRDYAVDNWNTFCVGRKQHSSIGFSMQRAVFEYPRGMPAFKATKGDECDVKNKKSYQITVADGFAEVAAGLEFMPHGITISEVVKRLAKDLRAENGSHQQGSTVSEEPSIKFAMNHLPAPSVAAIDLVDPRWLTTPPGSVHLSVFDRAPALTIAPSSVAGVEVVRGFKGFRSVRASHGVFEGSWYFEVTVLPWKGDGAVRLGWTNRRADIGTPVGFDENGFGIRDRGGEFFHQSYLTDYCDSYSTGDTIGCFIQLPTSMPRSVRARIADASVLFLNHRYSAWGDSPPPPTKLGNFPEGQAHVEFFKNGVSMGVPQRKDRIRIPVNEYYPTISLFKNAEVAVNFGPFERLPPGCRPMCDMAAAD